MSDDVGDYEPLPCPFCYGIMLGCNFTNYETPANPPDGLWAVTCDDCGTEGPVASNEGDAWERWDRRGRHPIRFEALQRKALREYLRTAQPDKIQ
jgi:hypothetical protein